MILVRHDAVPALDMQAMELMVFTAESAALVDEARLARGDRGRLAARQRPDALVVTRLEKLTD